MPPKKPTKRRIFRDARGRFVSKETFNVQRKLRKQVHQDIPGTALLDRARRVQDVSLGKPTSRERLPANVIYKRDSWKYTWVFKGPTAQLRAAALMYRVKLMELSNTSGIPIVVRTIVVPTQDGKTVNNVEIHAVSTPRPTYRDAGSAANWLAQGNFWASYKGLKGERLTIAEIWVVLIAPFKLEKFYGFPRSSTKPNRNSGHVRNNQRKKKTRRKVGKPVRRNVAKRTHGTRRKSNR